MPTSLVQFILSQQRKVLLARHFNVPRLRNATIRLEKKVWIFLCPYLVDADVLEAGEELPCPRDVLLALLVLDRTGQQALQSSEAGTKFSLKVRLIGIESSG